ncbi:MAG: hypothetical protein Ta2E_00520 [Mycoplasmoidaceae bacterium]|nr:MAG: hypothetical protein Ta2E_00520 [Mycoplasmoidaceae bacterium]
MANGNKIIAERKARKINLKALRHDKLQQYDERPKRNFKKYLLKEGMRVEQIAPNATVLTQSEQLGVKVYRNELKVELEQKRYEQR